MQVPHTWQYSAGVADPGDRALGASRNVPILCHPRLGGTVLNRRAERFVTRLGTRNDDRISAAGAASYRLRLAPLQFPGRGP